MGAWRAPLPALAFETPSLEEAFTLRRNTQLLRNDYSWHLFFLAFGLAGLAKWFTRGTLPPLSEVASICLYTGWSPAILYLIKRRPAWYVAHRNSVLVAMRLVRTTAMMRNLGQREQLWLGVAQGLPSGALKTYVHICYKATFMLLSSVAIVLPLRLYLPCQLPFLILMLRAAALRCAVECGAGQPGGLDACGPAEAALLEGAAGSCPASSVALQVQGFYEAVARLIRRVSLRPPGRLPPAWRPGGTTAAGCLGTCFAVHAWLQAVGGMLFPLALLWLWEERLRARELCLWQQQLALQREQQQQQQQPEQQQQRRQQLHETGAPGLFRHDLPLSFATVAAWLTASCWALWLGLEAAFL